MQRLGSPSDLSSNPSVVALDPIARLGRWWFKRRGVSPLPLLILCVVLPPDFVLSIVQLTITAVGILVAEGVRLWAVGYAGSATRTRADAVPALVHAGPFRYVRNPLYLANILMYTLAGVAFGFWSLGIVIAVYFSVQYHFIVAFEEQILRQQFGVAYDYYSARVPRWVPAFKPQVEPSHHRFEGRAALRSERSTLVALVTLAAIWALRQSL